MRMAEEVKCQISPELTKAINRWGAEVFTEEEIETRTEGHARLKTPLAFFVLAEEIRSGGGKRQVIRNKIEMNIIGFVRLIDDLADALRKYTNSYVLCVLDGLDHVDAEPCFELLNGHFETLTMPKISKIVVVPLCLFNTAFLAAIGKQFSTVPNIKVFTEAGSGKVNEKGLAFYKAVISRYVSLDLFTEGSLRSLFLLSAGILRDMIRDTGDACGYAIETKASLVSEEHVERVWFETMRFYRSQLYAKDYEVLRKVEANPHIEGIDDVPRLLHSKAVVFYPNEEGWYGVHPAIRRMLGFANPKANR